MPFATPGNRHGRAFPQVPTDSRPLRQAKRRGRASSAIGECAADERGGKFSASQSFENSENAERISPQGARPLHSPLRSRACPEMAPQGLEKIESAPGNGMVSEASNPQDVVHRRAAGPCPIGSLSPGARPAKQRRWRPLIAPTNEEENFPPRKALKSHKTRKSTREGSLPELAASSRSFLAPAAPSAATMGTPWRPSSVQGLGERQIPLAERRLPRRKNLETALLGARKSVPVRSRSKAMGGGARAFANARSAVRGREREKDRSRGRRGLPRRRRFPRA